MIRIHRGCELTAHAVLVLASLAVLAPSLRADPPAPDRLPSYFAWLTAGTGELGAPLDGTPPRFAFKSSVAVISPKHLSEAAEPLSDFGSAVGPAVVGKSGDGKATWVATDVSYGFACGMAGCDQMTPPRVHGLALFDASLHAVAWSTGLVVAGSFVPNKPPPPIKPMTPPALANAIDAGAEPAAAVFKASLADPEALANTVADRKDAVLYGSELAERYVGAPAVRATLRKWQLGFTVRDGIQAGVTGSRTSAWVAANVDAGKHGDQKTTPYRVFAIYDQHGADWQLVALQFSAPTMTAAPKP
ncbi:MAG TPA: hypothetical protein VGF94_29200 [Kofleriaceae bacterium]|jgi:hypothetical protein